MRQRIARALGARMHYAWVVAAVVFLVIVVGAGLRSAGGVLIVPLEQAFGWNRTTVSWPISVGLLLYGWVGPFSAALMQRFGLRSVVVAALALMTGGAGLSLVASEPWHLVLTWGVMLGVGTGSVAVLLGAIVANRWFAVQRGFVLGCFMAASAAGQMIFLPLLAVLAERGGWQAIAWTCGLAAVAVVPLFLLLVPERPKDVALQPYGARGDMKNDPGPKPMGNPIIESFRALWDVRASKDFWLLGGAFVICGVTTNGLVGTHLIPMCFDAGVPQVMAAGLLAAMGFFNMAGATLSGWLSDRFDNGRLLACYYALRGLSLLYLPHSDFTFLGLTVFSVVYGLDWIATGPPTIRLLSDLYGKERGPILFGWVLAMHQVGAALAAWGAGAFRVALGSYFEAFLIAGAAGFAAALMCLRIGQPKAPPLRPAVA